MMPTNSSATEAVLSRWERWVVLVLWLLAALLPELMLWVVFGFDDFFNPLLWLVTAGATAPAMGRVLGQVAPLDAIARTSPALTHLPPPLARLAEEAAAIVDDLDGLGLEAALERTWVLSCEFDQLPAELTAMFEASRAALAPVRALIDLRTEPVARLSPSRQLASLSAALQAFAASLAEPTHRGFR